MKDFDVSHPCFPRKDVCWHYSVYSYQVGFLPPSPTLALPPSVHLLHLRLLLSVHPAASVSLSARATGSGDISLSLPCPRDAARGGASPARASAGRGGGRRCDRGGSARGPTRIPERRSSPHPGIVPALASLSRERIRAARACHPLLAFFLSRSLARLDATRDFGSSSSQPRAAAGRVRELHAGRQRHPLYKRTYRACHGLVHRCYVVQFRGPLRRNKKKGTSTPVLRFLSRLCARVSDRGTALVPDKTAPAEMECLDLSSTMVDYKSSGKSRLAGRLDTRATHI